MWSGVAAANDVSEEPASESRWYGWQIMIADAVAAGLIVQSIGSPANVSETRQNLGGVGFGTYALGGPIVHWAHGRVGTGFGSLGLRVGFPFALLVAFVGVCWGKQCDSGEPEIFEGLAVAAFLTPPIIDYTLLAFTPKRAAQTSRAPALRLAPAIGSVHDAQRRLVPTLSLALDGL
jgi:hypothetical protein